jgi:hypothetical protein
MLKWSESGRIQRVFREVLLALSDNPKPTNFIHTIFEHSTMLSNLSVALPEPSGEDMVSTDYIDPIWFSNEALIKIFNKR